MADQIKRVEPGRGEELLVVHGSRGDGGGWYSREIVTDSWTERAGKRINAA